MPFALTVFSELTKTHKRTDLINKLRNYFEVYVDAVNTAPILLKEKYGSSIHRFFGHDCDELIVFDVEVVDMIEPEFIVTFDKQISKKEWRDIFLFFRNLLDEIPDAKYFEKIKHLIDVQTKCTLKSSTPQIEEAKYDHQYIFNMDLDEEKNIGFFEIQKPFTDRPYTTIIRNFKERGFLPLFTSLYIDSTWGLAMDNNFLKQLWVHLGLNAKIGLLDLEKEVKDHISRCSPENGIPEAEPEVYRMNILNLKIELEQRNNRYDEVLSNLRVKRQKLTEEIY